MNDENYRRSNEEEQNAHQLLSQQINSYLSPEGIRHFQELLDATDEEITSGKGDAARIVSLLQRLAEVVYPTGFEQLEQANIATLQRILFGIGRIRSQVRGGAKIFADGRNSATLADLAILLEKINPDDRTIDEMLDVD